MKLTYTESQFINEYVKNGGNGTQAYMAVRPNISARSAAVSANRLQKKTNVIAAIEKIKVKSTKECIASRSRLISEAHTHKL